MQDNKRAGDRWTREEDAALVFQFIMKMPIAEIAADHKRSSGGITSRLGKLLGWDTDKVNQAYRELELPTKEDIAAQTLMELGYRKISNKHCMVARIDRPDWLQYMANHMSLTVADFHLSGRINGLVGNTWADHYRRTYSKDTKTLSVEEIKLIESSCGDLVGYVDLESKKPDLVDNMYICDNCCYVGTIDIS